MSNVQIRKEKDHFHVKLNRPDKHNAFTPDMIRELTDFFKTAEENKFARFILLTGAGPSFCAGADLEWMKSVAKFKLKQNQADAQSLFEMFESASDCSLPIVGYVQGSVFGGGLGLVSICDVAIAEFNAKFCFSEAKLGLIPAVISSFVVKKMQANKVRELMITARVFDSTTAYASGLVEFVGRELEAKAYLSETMKLIADNGPEAIKGIKRLLEFLETADKKETKSESVKVIAEQRVSSEGQEGMTSFLQKRKPAWVRSTNEDDEEE